LSVVSQLEVEAEQLVSAARTRAAELASQAEENARRIAAEQERSAAVEIVRIREEARGALERELQDARSTEQARQIALTNRAKARVEGAARGVVDRLKGRA
jgi:vacuolar-type H+-ATPase subunit H